MTMDFPSTIAVVAALVGAAVMSGVAPPTEPPRDVEPRVTAEPRCVHFHAGPHGGFHARGEQCRRAAATACSSTHGGRSFPMRIGIATGLPPSEEHS
jgi:hypothetical protein